MSAPSDVRAGVLQLHRWGPGPAQEAALAGYQAERDRLATPMLAAVERLASYEWDLAVVPTLLRTLAGTMTDEVELLAGLSVAA